MRRHNMKARGMHTRMIAVYARCGMHTRLLTRIQTDKKNF